MIKLLPILVAIFLIYLSSLYYKKLPADQKKPFVIKWLVYLTIALLVLAFISGKISWLGAVAAGILGALKMGANTIFRFLPFIRFLQNKHVFGNPVFRTPFLELKLDIGAKVFTGLVLKGEFKDKSLSDLDETQLDSLEVQLQKQDKRGYYLLRVYRQRNQHSSDTSSYEPVQDPSIEEARLILGLSSHFTKQELDKSYKQLMQKLHPDRGGNDYLASRVNRARDLLIDHLKKQN